MLPTFSILSRLNSSPSSWQSISHLLLCYCLPDVSLEFPSPVATSLPFYNSCPPKVWPTLSGIPLWIHHTESHWASLCPLGSFIFPLTSPFPVIISTHKCLFQEFCPLLKAGWASSIDILDSSTTPNLNSSCLSYGQLSVQWEEMGSSLPIGQRAGSYKIDNLSLNWELTFLILNSFQWVNNAIVFIIHMLTYLAEISDLASQYCH